jgi:hypothetical protein
MTIEFWPRRCLTPYPARKPKKPRNRRMPKLPIPAGKAHQKLSQAIICDDHELASWLDLAVKVNMVTGTPHLVGELRTRLDAVMAPLEKDEPSSSLSA